MGNDVLDSKKRLSGKTYKKLMKSWTKVPKLSAGSPRKRNELSRENVRGTESNDCAKAEEKVVKISFSSLKKHRVNCNSEEQFSSDNAALAHKLNGVSHSRFEESERKENKSTNGQRDNKFGKEHVACSICKFDGDLLGCDGKGCNRRFHLSCVDPPFTFAPPGVWHCVWCVQNKIKNGIYSVSEGIESILDVREVDLDHEVMQMQKQKQHLVKYKGLAHVHNCWIPEKELKEKAKSLFAHKTQFNGIVRKTECALPHRLLQKRRIFLPEKNEKDLNDCQYEWLVKWKGLEYNRATWELETASFLNSPEAARLMTEFENRHKNEKKTPSDEIIKSPYKGQDKNEIEKLRKCWSKKKSSILFENEERFAKLVLFILSLKDNNLPFLIIAPCGSISEWEAEFSRHESSNIVVYRGHKNVRSSIRSLEFYNKYGCIMFQVLLSTPSIVVEDLRSLEGINWGGVIVDDCQRPVSYSNLNQIKSMPTDMRLLIATDHISDKGYVYKSLLSFINSGIDEEKENASDSDDSGPDNDISNLKKKLACLVAYEFKHQAPGFSEYWVPVMLSNLQLEQYCAALLSNSMFLCSSQPNDLSYPLRELLIFEKECCDHPYIVDPDNSLRRPLTDDFSLVERLNSEIEMSGKLQFLDKCLLRSKEQGLRVLIVFQPSVSSGKITTGDILDDFVHHRFGKDSYVHIGGRDIVPNIKQTALRLFNDKKGSQFIFLLDRRACLPSIRLSSVDTVILFDSDWDPLNDLKALQKISFQSKCKNLKIFRLYSIHTVEEMVLILAKQGLAPDNLKNARRGTCNKLLTWGALRLFDKLDKFHSQNESDQSPSLADDKCFLNDVLSEFSDLLFRNKENINTDTNIILKVLQNEGNYVKNVLLHGEVEAESGDSISSIEKLMRNESFIVYWENILKGRSPRWKFLPSSLDTVESEHTDKILEEIISTETDARRVEISSIQWKRVMTRKRRSIDNRNCNDSAGLGHPPCKKPKSSHEMDDKKAESSGKKGFSSKKNQANCIPRKRVRKSSDPIRKESQFVEIRDKKDGSNGKIESLSKKNKADCISRKRVRKRSAPNKKEGEFGKANKLIIRDLPASELISSRLATNKTHISPAQGGTILHQVPDTQSLVALTLLDDFDNSSTFLPPILPQIDQCLDIPLSVNTTKSFPISQNTETLLAYNTEIPQAPNIPLPVPNSTLLEPQQRDLEIMQKVIEQALMTKQDTKSQLRAEFEKEIDQVTTKYVKLLKDVEMELSQKANELEMYYNKVNESKLIVTAEAAKSSRIRQGTKKSDKKHEKLSSPSLSLSSPLPKNIEPPATAHNYPAFRSLSPFAPMGPIFEIRDPAPHLRAPCVPTKISPQKPSELISPHLGTILGPIICENISKNTISCPQEAVDNVSSLSTSDILNQLFTGLI